MLSFVDLIVLIGYLLGVVLFGCFFARKSSSTSTFMTAGGTLPAWAVGLSIFGTYLSSNTFLGVPGKAYGSNWNALVFSLSLPLAAWLATRFFVPFYRQSGEISAYQHLERRFGTWARTYAVVCYLLTQFARTGTILFGVSLVMSALTGWNQSLIIVVAGALITLYTVLGGIEAVIWTDVVQSLVLIAGAVVILILLLTGLPEGPTQVFAFGASHDKFSLGSFDLDLTSSTFWVVLLYGLFINLSNFGIDQSFVQRYHTARDERQASRSVWLGAMLYMPISLLFFFIGTSAFSFYHTHPDQLENLRRQTAEERLVQAKSPISETTIGQKAANLTDAELGDKVLPHFIVHALPVGARGLLIAAILAAAMSSIDTSLNSSATVLLTDIYKRFIRPFAGERESMVVLYSATLLMGIAGTAAAVAMIGVQSVLDAWWLLSGIFAGGVLGLFLLGIMSRRTGNFAAVVGVVFGFIAILSMSWPQLLEIAKLRGWQVVSQFAVPSLLTMRLHENMTIVVGTLTILFVGILVTRLGGTKNTVGLSFQESKE
ncbi:sodium:solute symporter [Bythopirellula polymerisocia]|uniref:Sodium/glucose cotransporter n=1 Tax=Bythopirellula polymerisocia TaxID=2528003 RepID=A0A5C6CTJ4_9BACT|nr:sodium:solute symporter [Bythopirellula polymerisocia]TWU27718.1 Sodium/glucose cotransporter [Bythopirellula polymerisocia]